MLGLIEQWGGGIERMIAACRDAGLDDPRLKEIGSHFRVTLYSAKKRTAQINDVERQIVNALAKEDGLSTQEIAARIKLSSRATRTRLIVLEARGLVAEVGTSPQDPRRKYFLTKGTLE